MKGVTRSLDYSSSDIEASSDYWSLFVSLQCALCYAGLFEPLQFRRFAQDVLGVKHCVPAQDWSTQVQDLG